MKIAWAAAVFIMAMIAIGVQVDRAARKESRMADFVPPIFQHDALYTLARREYAIGNEKTAVAYSQKLLVRRPIPAESLALITMGLINEGKNRNALLALLLSAQRGWRDRYTQRLVITSAQEAGDYKVAAQRLLALWRIGDREAETQYLTQNLLKHPEAAAKFGEGIVKADQSWGTDFLVSTSDYLPARSVSLIVDSMSAVGNELDCRRIFGAAVKLVRMGKPVLATALWSGACHRGSMTLANDFVFKASSAASGPFDWEFPEKRGLDVKVINRGNSASLYYKNSTQTRIAIAKRNAVLSSGMHNVRIGFEGRETFGSSAVTFQVTCLTAKGLAANYMRIELISKFRFEIPDLNCKSQQLLILASRGKGEIGQLTIEPNS